MIRPSIPEKKGAFTCDTNFGTQCRLFRSPKLFTLATLIPGIGIFDYLKWFCGYPIGYGLGQNLRQCLTSNGKLGTAIISVYCFNMLILGFTIMFFVSTSPLCVIQVSEWHLCIISKLWQCWSVSTDDNYGMMLGHYCLFLTVVNKWVGFYVCILFAKLKGIKTGHVGNRLDGAPALLLTWLWTKYQCHYPLELSIHAFALLILPIGHFYNLIGQPAIFLPYKFHNDYFIPL